MSSSCKHSCIWCAVIKQVLEPNPVSIRHGKINPKLTVMSPFILELLDLLMILWMWSLDLRHLGLIWTVCLPSFLLSLFPPSLLHYLILSFFSFFPSFPLALFPCFPLFPSFPLSLFPSFLLSLFLSAGWFSEPLRPNALYCNTVAFERAWFSSMQLVTILFAPQDRRNRRLLLYASNWRPPTKPSRGQTFQSTPAIFRPILVCICLRSPFWHIYHLNLCMPLHHFFSFLLILSSSHSQFFSSSCSALPVQYLHRTFYIIYNIT